MQHTSFKTALVLVAISLVFKVSSASAATPKYCLRVPVLMYHHVQPMADAVVKKQSGLTVDSAMFDRHMAYLNLKGYHSIDAKDLVTALINHSSLPPKSIVITLDDGYADAYTFAYPIVQKYNIKMNLMISTGLVNNPDYLTWDQLKTMVNSGMVTTHNHTWSHANLPRATLQKQDFEITTASLQLQNNLNQNSEIFAYPYGGKNAAIKTLLKQKNFLAAFSTSPGTYECDQNIFDLPRVRIGNAPLSHYGL